MLAVRLVRHSILPSCKTPHLTYGYGFGTGKTLISGKPDFGISQRSFCFSRWSSISRSSPHSFPSKFGCQSCRLQNYLPKRTTSRTFSSGSQNRLTTKQWKKLQTYLRTLFRRKSSKAEVKTDEKAATKATPKASDVKRLLSLAKPEKWKIAAAVFLLLISSGVSMSVPFCIGKVIDLIYNSKEEGKLTENLTFVCKILLGIFFLGAAANFGRVYLINISGSNIIKRLREKLFTSIMRQEVGFFDKNKTGELINRLSADTSIVGTSVTNNISDGLRALAQGIGGVCMMMYVSPKLTCIALAIVPPLILMSRIYGAYVRKLTKQVQDSLASATQVAEERISNIRTVRSFAQEHREIDQYNQKITDILKLAYKESLARGVFWASTGLSGNIIVLSVFYYGGMMMQDSTITIGDLSAFLLYAAYSGVSISGLTSFYSEMMKGLGASSRLWYLTDKEPLIPISGGLIPQGPLSGNIDFQNVVFSYPTREEVAIFSGLNLMVPAGSMTAVVGSSGSGKSTIGSLLLRFYDPVQGSIRLDGKDIRSLDPLWLRHHIGTVSQEPTLFSCTIAENIKYGASDPSSVTQLQIEDAAHKANAFNFIQTFPDSFNTLVGERGIMLSGGQKQRIAIARAILKDPKILLLDEATSALDAESEFLVQDALEHLMVGRTVITIAHRLSTIKSADQIAVLDKGRIAEVGSYQQLMAIPDGLFKKLVERQTITN